MGDGDRTDNVSIANSDNSKIVDIITDGSIERLAVDANVDGGVQFQKFSTESDSEIDSAIVLNTSTDTSLLLITGEGKLDFVSVNSLTSSNFEVIIKINGIERFRLPMSGFTTLGLTSGENVPLWADTAAKNFRYHPNEGDDFTSSFEILAKAIVATPSVFWAVKWREVI